MRTHPHIPHPFAGVNEKIGDKINKIFGSMATFWVFICWQIGWMLLASFGAPLLKRDPYPFVFLLFLSNLIQLVALPILGNTQNRADAKRDAKADADHLALTYIATQVDAGLRTIDEMREELRQHPWGKE